MNSVLAHIPLSTQNAIEVLAVTRKYKDELNCKFACTDLKQRLTTAVNAWTTPLQVLKFWSENKNNIDLVSDLFETCFQAKQSVLITKVYDDYENGVCSPYHSSSDSEY